MTIVLVAAALVLGGCPAQDSDLGPIVSTSIPPGIYTGHYTSETVTTLNGVELDRRETDHPYNEVVDTHGLPLVQPDGVTPRTGAETSLQLGDVSATLTIRSVNADGRRLVVYFDITALQGEQVISGFGSWTYEYTADETLEYVEQITAASSTPSGLAVSTLIGTATLTK